ncbi:MAG TPA: hypothetical protein VGJ30_04445 [Candidatus Angelobacter sp.]
MGRPYGDDLRREFLSAHDEGESTQEELAERFVLSLGWAKKISAQHNRTGLAERVPHQPARKLRAGSEAQQQVRDWIWYLLRRLGPRLKKVAPRQRAGHGRQPQAASGIHRAAWLGPARTIDLSGRKRGHDVHDSAPCSLYGGPAHP